MNREIIKINTNSWRIEDDGVRMFLITGTEKALLIDTGMNIHDAKDIASTLTELPISLLNTHADIDHIGSNEQFDSFYMHPADEPLYRSLGKKGNIIHINDGDIIDLGERRLEIIHIPGHTAGSIAILDIDARVLISGDTLQEHGHIFMFGDHRNMVEYIRSLEKLETCREKFDEIWPSHGDIPISPDVIKKLHDGAQDILDGKLTGKRAERFGTTFIVYDLGFCLILFDR